MAEAVTKIRYAHDTLGVCTACLSNILRDWVERWDKAHPPENCFGNRYAPARLHGARKDKLALSFLSDELGVSVRQLQRILSANQATTALSLADNLLCAIDRTYELQALAVYQRNSRRIPGYYGYGHVCELGVLKLAA